MSRLTCPICDKSLFYEQTVSESGFLEVQGPSISLEWHDTESRGGLIISCATKDCEFELENFPKLNRRITLNLG
ncbi:hypothetical protein LCGC14_0275990 [marine sediment metagenome]|uniref:Uncharacterized protein n=1 Tax=marine sediment metagenome TaxID=412755 RepID=A0A0F9UEN0_9ZZZZ